MLTVGDLFSGVGGFALGLERAGMCTRWFAEVDPFASAVLRKHWPDVPNHGDVRSVRAGRVEHVDVICGGFPCQDISIAGSGRGLEGERSGLWREMHRIVGELRPRYALVENVGALTSRGLAVVLGDLAAIGYDAEWHVVPVAAVDAPHLRERCWIIAVDADADRERLRHDEQRAPSGRIEVRDSGHAEPVDDGPPLAYSDTYGRRCERDRIAQHGDGQGASRPEPDGLGAPGLRTGPGGGRSYYQRRGRASGKASGRSGRSHIRTGSRAATWTRRCRSRLARRAACPRNSSSG